MHRIKNSPRYTCAYRTYIEASFFVLSLLSFSAHFFIFLYRLVSDEPFFDGHTHRTQLTHEHSHDVVAHWFPASNRKTQHDSVIDPIVNPFISHVAISCTYNFFLLATIQLPEHLPHLLIRRMRPQKMSIYTSCAVDYSLRITH